MTEEAPRRITLSRAKGWKMPPNTVKVDRTTKWGNPWRIGKWGPLRLMAPDATGAVGLFTQMLMDPETQASAEYPGDLTPLRGKNLACWCKPGEPCHADVLLDWANYDPVHIDVDRMEHALASQRFSVPSGLTHEELHRFILDYAAGKVAPDATATKGKL